METLNEQKAGDDQKAAQEQGNKNSQEAANHQLDKWLAIPASILALFTTLVVILDEFLIRIHEVVYLRIAASAVLVIFLIVSGWLLWKARIKPFWRTVDISALFIFTSLFTFWVGTWIHVPFRANPDTFPIHQGGVTSYLYEGARNADVGQGSAYLAVTEDTSKGSFISSYRLDYTLPDEGGGYAGVALEFSQPQDLSAYNYIELTISFDDPAARCRLFIKDSFYEDDFVVLGDGTIIGAQKEKQTVKLSLDTYFSFVSRKYIKEIAIDVNSEFVRGKHTLTVSDIRFTK